MKILLLFAHPHEVPTLYELLYSVEHALKKDPSLNNFVQTIKVNWVLLFLSPLNFTLWTKIVKTRKKRIHASLEWWQYFHFGWTIPHNKVYSCTVKFLYLIFNEERWLVSTFLSFQLCACLVYLWVVATKLLAFLILSTIVKLVTYCV